MYAYALPVIHAEPAKGKMFGEMPLYGIDGLGFAPVLIDGPKNATLKVLFLAVTEPEEGGAHHAEIVVLDPSGKPLQQLNEDHHPIRSIHEWVAGKDWTMEARTFDLDVNVWVGGVFMIALKIDDRDRGRWPLLVVDKAKLPIREN